MPLSGMNSAWSRRRWSNSYTQAANITKTTMDDLWVFLKFVAFKLLWGLCLISRGTKVISIFNELQQMRGIHKKRWIQIIDVIQHQQGFSHSHLCEVHKNIHVTFDLWKFMKQCLNWLGSNLRQRWKQPCSHDFGGVHCLFWSVQSSPMSSPQSRDTCITNIPHLLIHESMLHINSMTMKVGISLLNSIQNECQHG